jgi:cell shape-determining protein MreC
MTDPYINKQFKIIEATLKNAKIEIELLREENDRLTEMLQFMLKKSGDIHAEQTA